MALRSTMTALIGRLRRLVGDADAQAPAWTDEELQERLDERRQRVRYEPLLALPSYGAGGVVSYTEFQACQGDWEEGAQVVDADYALVEGLSFDSQGGRWTSSTPLTPPLFVSGWVYDLPGVGADVCEAWAARLKANVDIADAGASLKRSQQVEALLTLSRRFRERQRVPTVRMARLDVESNALEASR